MMASRVPGAALVVAVLASPAFAQEGDGTGPPGERPTDAAPDDARERGPEDAERGAEGAAPDAEGGAPGVGRATDVTAPRGRGDRLEPLAPRDPPAGEGGGEPVSFGVDLYAFFHWNETNVEHERGGGGNEIDVDSETPVDAFAVAGQVDLWVAFRDTWRIEGGWLGAYYDGTGRLGDGFVHSGVGFPAGDRVRVQTDWHMAWGGARVDFLADEDVRLGFPFGIVWTSERVTLDSRDGPRRASGRVYSLGPYVGFHAGFTPAPRLGVELEARLFPYPAFLDVSATVRYEVVDHVALVAGPRAVLVGFKRKVNDNQRLLELAAGGFLAGVSFRY